MNKYSDNIVFPTVNIGDLQKLSNHVGEPCMTEEDIYQVAYTAVKNGDSQSVKDLLATFLYLGVVLAKDAAFFDQLEILDYLVNMGVNPGKNATMLVLASRGNLDLVRKYLQVIKNQHPKSLSVTFHIALQALDEDNLDLLKIVLEYDEDIPEIARYAIIKRKYDIMKYLLKTYLQLLEVPNELLVTAAEYGPLSLVKYLYEKQKFSKNYVQKALSIAIDKNRQKTIKYLTK